MGPRPAMFFSVTGDGWPVIFRFFNAVAVDAMLRAGRRRQMASRRPFLFGKTADGCPAFPGESFTMQLKGKKKYCGGKGSVVNGRF
ncbi:unnamed protein product [Nippostrongylus brasiliensis]|uniref:Transposase n=1 Tax=Nippostrongylus brasiliensis TaxID=27835 RepID=A0A0N4XR27_NIPBR|nr:unnamed protein product [Nippostrongylus brasiliensis]